MTDLVRVNVLAVAGTDVTVGIPDGRGGQATVVLSPPYVSAQFIPDAGGTALLMLSGPIPKLLPESIAVDAITAREIQAGSILAEHITAGSLDGQTITGATVQTAATGARVVQDALGLRLVNAAGVTVADFSTVTGDALLTGEYRTAVGGQRFIINPGGVAPGELRFYPVTGIAYGSIVALDVPFYGVGLTATGPLVGGQSGGWALSANEAAMFYGSSSANPSANFYVTNGLARIRAGGATRQLDVGQIATTITHVNNVNVASPHLNVSGDVGFNGAPPLAKPTLPAAATDLASVIALTNAIRMALINYGLAA